MYVAVNVTRATVCINVSPLSYLVPKFTSLLCECTLHKIPVFKKQFTVLYFLLYHNQVKVTLNWRNGKLCFKAVCISPVSGLVNLYIGSNKAFFILLIGYPFALLRLLFHDCVIKTCFKSSLVFSYQIHHKACVDAEEQLSGKRAAAGAWVGGGGERQAGFWHQKVLWLKFWSLYSMILAKVWPKILQMM